MEGHHKDQTTNRKPNRLVNEQSPYLRQHAYNPVDWYPWGDEALARAKAENKPILLSIGYSACHWCHVMERESFENEEIARLMNENFVCIKVDREERPDLDQIYMDAVQLFAGRGGWPLTMFLTPEGKPFFGGTYFPPEDRHGIAGFGRVLRSVTQAYRDRAQEVAHNVDRLTRALGEMAKYQPAEGDFRRDLVELAARALAQHYDNINGGIGDAPKFPNVFVFSLFLRVLDESGDLLFADMVRETLTKMAKGGICDQLGGGFHRYSVDDQWLVPHFEKMLYDNALLAQLYLDAGRALDQPECLQTARRIFDYVLREMTSPEGGFYSSQDADSEGHEGKFFVWTLDEVDEVLGEKLAPIARRYFDITEQGNFEGENILHRTIDIAEAAVLFKMTEEQTAEAVEEIERKLFARRETRVRPGRDEKILAAWNGLMISAFAEGYRALGETRYLETARRAADFVMTKLWDGRSLRRSYKDGAARFNAYLEDYAVVANALIDLYEASLEPEYLANARELADMILDRFLDRDSGGFFFTSDDHERLIIRSKAAFDGSTPSGNSEAIMALLRLHAYSGEERYLKEAERALQLFRPLMEKQPFAFARMLAAVDFYLRGPKEIVLVGERESKESGLWLERLGLRYLPNRTIFALKPGAELPGLALPEQVRGKSQIDGQLTAYLCHEHVCSPPQTTIEGLEAELSK
ncbi:MAG TPA: thioredoxin domain-containing protein [Candidatus Binataceae bacterium]|nr:thioredoxin domain-containing protein [Candidatus Binataceae bacterium]